MPDLEFRSARSQLNRERMHVILFGVLLAGSVATYVFVPIGLLIFCMVVFAVITAQSGYWLWAYSRAYTRCTPSGIRTLGLTGSRDVPWASVRDIGRTRYGSAVVATAGGKRVRLGAPVLNMSFGGALDRDYGTKLAQLREYWQVMRGKMTSA